MKPEARTQEELTESDFLEMFFDEDKSFHKDFCGTVGINDDLTIQKPEFEALLDEIAAAYHEDTNAKKSIAKKHLRSVLIALIQCFFTKWLVLSISSKESLSGLINWLSANDYIHFKRGDSHRKVMTAVAPKMKLMSLVIDAGISSRDITFINEMKCFKLKDSEKKVIDAEPTQRDFKKYFSTTQKMNDLYRRHNVQLTVDFMTTEGSVTLAPPFLYRIGNNVQKTQRSASIPESYMRHHARYLRSQSEYERKVIGIHRWCDEIHKGERAFPHFYEGVSYQTLSGDVNKPFSRSRMRINGEAVTECDFSCMFPSMLYSKLGITIDGDIYRCDDYTDEEWTSKYRPVYKQCFNTLLNSSSESSFKKAVNSSLNKGEIYFDKEELSVQKILDDTLEAHPVLTETDIWFNDSANELFYLESCIAEEVMRAYISMDKVVLPMFDGFIVMNSENNQSELIEIMREAYTSVLGSRDNCLIKVEY